MKKHIQNAAKTFLLISLFLYLNCTAVLAKEPAVPKLDSVFLRNLTNSLIIGSDWDPQAAVFVRAERLMPDIGSDGFTLRELKACVSQYGLYSASHVDRNGNASFWCGQLSLYLTLDQAMVRSLQTALDAQQNSSDVFNEEDNLLYDIPLGSDTSIWVCIARSGYSQETNETYFLPEDLPRFQETIAMIEYVNTHESDNSTKSKPVVPIQEESSVPIQEEFAVPTQEESAVPIQEEFAVPTQEESAAPAQEEPAVPTQEPAISTQ